MFFFSVRCYIQETVAAWSYPSGYFVGPTRAGEPYGWPLQGGRAKGFIDANGEDTSDIPGKNNLILI